MKLIRFGEPGREKPGVLLGGKRRDLSAHVRDYDRDFFNGGGLDKLKALIGNELPDVPEDARWGAPVARPGKVVAIGLNFCDHARETGAELPGEPVVFFKAANTVAGPYDDLIIPRGSKKTDWEVELGIVISKDARYLDSPERSGDHIAGYTICHDVSERHLQLERGGQWSKGKSCDGFCPIGPALTTPDEAGDVTNLDMTLEVNGERMQSSNTSNMIFDVFFLVHYLSQFMTLEAGDLISTGTPPGVGMGRTPPRYLQAGDLVELRVQGLGTLRQTCVNAD